MIRSLKTATLTALAATALGTGLVGCDEDALDGFDPLASSSQKAEVDTFTGTKEIEVGGKRVNVSCTGEFADGEPVIVLMHGGGDALDKLAPLQKTLATDHRVCSYDRLGAGKSAKPDGPQSFDSTGKVLTGLLDEIAGQNPVVLAGHSLGGLIAARYAPAHQERVAGLVLMDATPATMVADISKIIPASEQGPAAQVRAQNLAIFAGQNPEKLVIEDGPVKSAGDIPVEVIKHGQPYLAAVPQYGDKLEQAWTAGQREWLELSDAAKLTVADKAGHYIYQDTPDIAVKTIKDVTAKASGA
ncbi:alpha/beta fold hydrolase [Actinomadura sp. WMMB 499]|uniref:alpha/beta fold hydrolase n=1 Tax=Actinomadura sp. WMMB 499 TaxID=1219491 RepID=UPI00159D635C|nr:alpha/beta hydrolase family protein [Actinomadura sp. WMMB 499]